MAEPQAPSESPPSEPPSPREQPIEELSAILRIRLRWPNIEIRDFTPEEDAHFRSWVTALSDEALTEELRQRREQWLRQNEAEIRRGAAEADAGEDPPDVIFR